MGIMPFGVENINKAQENWREFPHKLQNMYVLTTGNAIQSYANCLSANYGYFFHQSERKILIRRVLLIPFGRYYPISGFVQQSSAGLLYLRANPIRKLHAKHRG